MNSGQQSFSWGQKPITVLSFGGGQDSTALLLMCMHDPVFRQTYAPGEILCVMSDTGDEHGETYEHVAKMKLLCKDFDYIHFVLVTPDMGFHAKTWPTLRSQMERNNTVMSKGFAKSCTDKLKLGPLYRYVEHWISARCGFRGKKKAAYYGYKKMFGRLNVIIGIAAGEEKRLGGQIPNVWGKRCLNRVYPLVELGYDRARCQQIIAGYGAKVPMPSNCILCPWMSKQELLYMHRFLRDDFDYWVIREKAKMAKPVPEGKNNLGVFGRKTLEVILQEAIANFGHWTDADLIKYKMSHGHCVKSKC